MQKLEQVLKNAQSNSSKTCKITGGAEVGRKCVLKANGPDTQHPQGWSRGPWDANKHCEPQPCPPWNLQMVYPGICLTLAVFHRY